MYLVLDLRLLIPALSVWLNAIGIFLIESHVLLTFVIIVLIFSLFFKITFKKDILLVIVFLLISTAILNLKLNSLNNNNILKIIDASESISISGEIKNDLIVRSNKNPYTKQDIFEANLNLEIVKANNQFWKTKIPIVLIFKDYPVGVVSGANIVATGSAKKSYRRDKAFIFEVDYYKVTYDPKLFDKNINLLRERFLQTAREVNNSAAGLVPGLVSGDTRLQSEELVTSMQKTGLTHLTAVSGGNIAILLAVFIWFLKLLKLRRRLVFMLSITLLVLFLFVVRFEPSAMRATVMGVIGVSALTFGGPRTSFGALNYSVIFLLLIDPFLAINWGFIFSVAATFGLIMISPQIQKYWVRKIPKTPKILVLLITMTVSAQLVTYPLMGVLVGEISLVSILANVLVAPTVAWVTVFGFLAMISAFVFDPVAIAFFYLALPGAIWIEQVAHFLGQFKFAQISVSGATLLTTLSIAGVLLVWYFMKRNLKNSSNES